jgi:nucleoid-associated protein EbfC
MQPPNTPDFAEIMKKAQEMQKKMQWTQQKLASLTVNGKAGPDDAVVIVMNGRHEVKKVTISEKALQEYKEKAILEDLIAAAINDAIRKVEELLKTEMQNLSRDLGIPSDLGGEGGAGGMLK